MIYSSFRLFLNSKICCQINHRNIILLSSSFSSHENMKRLNSKNGIQIISTSRIGNRLVCGHFLRLTSTEASAKKRVNLMEKAVGLMPSSMQPYARLMRLHQPTGVWLLLYPCLWSICLATPAGSFPSLTTIGLFTSGAVLMRGAGCVINDMWDKRYDAKVERTKSRPLASGEIQIPDASVFLVMQLLCAFSILLQFDLNSIILGASSLLLVLFYPIMKRFTHWPQIVLGMTFNWGALLGWSVTCNGSLYYPAVLPLYAAGICWTLIYDTIYAHQDKKDDLAIGLKSTAIKFGEDTVKWLSGFSATMCSSLLLSGIATNQCWPYYSSVMIIGAHLARQLTTLNINDPEDCGRKFRNNKQIGWILLLGIVLSTLLKDEENEIKSEKKSERKIEENPILKP